MRQLVPGVLVHQSVLLRNNTVAVQGRSGVLLIDPGLTGDEMLDVATSIDESGRPVVAGFATHPDWDHVLWHPAYGDPPRYGTARCAADMRELRAKVDWKSRVAEALPPEIAEEVPLDLFGLITAVPDGATEVPWDGPVSRMIEHGAHSVGHAALLIEEHRVLVAGDMLSDVFVPMLDLDAADPIGDYLAALSLFDDLKDAVDIVVPGHGSVGGSGELRTRVELDRAYVEALRDGRDVSDPRLGGSAEPGWEWVGGIHEWQVKRLAEKRRPTVGESDAAER